MEPQWNHLEDLPLRFVVPDGWREPHPEWISLHQGLSRRRAGSPIQTAHPHHLTGRFGKKTGGLVFLLSLPRPSAVSGNWLVVWPQRSGFVHRHGLPLCPGLPRVLTARASCPGGAGRGSDGVSADIEKKHPLGGQRSPGAGPTLVGYQARRVLSRGL